eukprot:1097512-Prorocentrum_minimum.AAC.1
MVPRIRSGWNRVTRPSNRCKRRTCPPAWRDGTDRTNNSRAMTGKAEDSPRASKTTLPSRNWLFLRVSKNSSALSS